MSFLLEWTKLVVSNFNGPKPELNLDDLVPGDALEASNVEYGKGSFSTRRPFKNLFTAPSGNVQGFMNWIQTGFNRAIYYSDTGFGAELRSYDLKSHVDISLGAVNPLCETFVASESGTRLYAAMVKSETGSGLNLPTGADRAVAIGQTPGGSSYQADPLWPPPINQGTEYTISLFSNFPLVGNVTPGSHNLVLVAQSRSGFQLVPGAVFNYVSTGGEDNYQCVFAGTIPAEIIRINFAMTPVGSTRYFIIPQTNNEFNSATGFVSATITLANITDDVTLQRGTEITSLFNNYYYGLGGFNLQPFNTITFGNRIGYMTQLPDITQSGTDQTVMYFSQPNYYQNINLATSRVQLPGARRGCAWFASRGVVYVFGPTYTYAFQDTNINPVQWSQGSLVDGQLGCSRQTAIFPNPGLGYAWVANESGLWRFSGGMYPQRDGAPLPNSYFQTPVWNRINFNCNAKGLWVVEVPKERQVHVFACLDGAVVPTHWLVFDYNNGTEPENIKFSLNELPVNAAGILMNPATAQTELSIAPTAHASHVWRLTRFGESGVTPSLDDGQYAYTTLYESGPTPAITDAVVGLHEIHFRAFGTGTLNVTAYSTDRTRSQALTPIVLTATLDAPIRRQLDTQSSGETLRMSCTGNLLVTQYIAYYDQIAAQV